VEAVEGQTRAKGGFPRRRTRRRRENRGDGSAARRGKGREANKRGEWVQEEPGRLGGVPVAA